VWERVYNPAEAKWSAWACVAGDTGEIQSVDKIIADTTPEEPLVHRNSPNNAILYDTKRRMIVQRQAGFVTISGAMRGYGVELTKTGSSGRSLGWFSTSSDALGPGDPGGDYTVSHLFPTAYATDGVPQASGQTRWYMCACMRHTQARFPARHHSLLAKERSNNGYLSTTIQTVQLFCPSGIRSQCDAQAVITLVTDLRRTPTYQLLLPSSAQQVAYF